MYVPQKYLQFHSHAVDHKISDYHSENAYNDTDMLLVIDLMDQHFRTILNNLTFC